MQTGFSPREPYRRPHGPAATPGADDETAESLFNQARTAFYREDEDAALDLLLEALRRAPHDLHAHYLAALCANLLSEEETLEDVCAHALAVNPRHPYSLACDAARYLFLSNFSRAEDLFRRSLQALPQDLDLHLGLGILYEYSGDEEKSMEMFRRALELDAHNVRARVSLGIAYAMSGEYQSALEEYQKAKEVDPTTENPHQRLGRDYYLEGMIEEATGEFRQAEAEEPDEPAAYFYLMDCYNRLSRTDDALDEYQAIRQRFATEPDLTSGFYEYFHMTSEAIATLETLAAQHPDDAEIRLRLSHMLQEAGRHDDALAAAEAAAEVDPQDARAFDLVGRYCFERGDYRRAITACRRAIKLDEHEQSAYVTLADALLFLGRDEESTATVARMEQVRQQAWKRYQDKFSGQDRVDGTD